MTDRIRSLRWVVIPDVIAVVTGVVAIGIWRFAMDLSGFAGQLHAFPSTDNVASNALCRCFGFRSLGAVGFLRPSQPSGA